jgi:hypothetical protein
MAKKSGGRPGRPKSDRDDVTIRISRVLASRLRVLAGDKGVSVAQLADELFTPVLDRAWGQLVKRVEGKQEGKG